MLYEDDEWAEIKGMFKLGWFCCVLLSDGQFSRNHKVGFAFIAGR